MLGTRNSDNAVAAGAYFLVLLLLLVLLLALLLLVPRLALPGAPWTSFSQA